MLRGSMANVYWCHRCEVAVSGEEDVTACGSCGGGLEQIGWFESLEEDS